MAVQTTEANSPAALQIPQPLPGDFFGDPVPVQILKPLHGDTGQGAAPAKRMGFSFKKKVLKAFKVEKADLDSEQLELIGRELDHSMIVSGCAGSGKSVIAMYKTQQILAQGGDVILITLTKSLVRFMEQGDPEISVRDRCFYHWQWQDKQRPQADYVIVDEIQDFTRSEIEEFIRAARKCFFFFGDSAQSIYEGMPGKEEILSLKEISELTGVKISYLNSNYRLPKSVARITQNYVNPDPDAEPYSDAMYQSKENGLPYIVKFPGEEAQNQAIIDLIKAKDYKNTGILVPDNDQVMALRNFFKARDFPCETKYNATENDPRNLNELDFTSSKPKILTFHSAKGVQFETVILPYFGEKTKSGSAKSLYVAMTRTYRNLYVFYTTEALAAPLDKVPEHLYRSSL